MNEEEKKAIKYFKALDKLTFEPYLSILLNLLDKQQKEIEELKTIIKAEIVLGENFPEDTKMILMCKKDFLRNYETAYISKDKIREKIKELEQIQNTALIGTTIEIMDYKITVLKQLLEE